MPIAVTRKQLERFDQSKWDSLFKEFEEAMQTTQRLASGGYQRGTPSGSSPTQSKPTGNGPKRQEWLELVQRFRDAGMSPNQAVSAANRENEGLRLAMLAERNGH